MNFSAFFPRHAFAFKGGGGGTTVVQEAPAAPAPAAAPAKPPAAVPPVTERSIEVEMASRQTRVDAKRRKGLRSTILAGETGGYVTPEDQTKKTLLG